MRKVGVMESIETQHALSLNKANGSCREMYLQQFYIKHLSFTVDKETIIFMHILYNPRL